MKKLFLLALALSFSVQAQIVPASADLFARYHQDIRGKTNSEIFRDSVNDYDRFVGLDVNSHLYTRYAAMDYKKPRTLSLINAEVALDAAASNPVVALYQTDKYDPHQQGIGFCFGRAMFIHMYLTINGMNRANIKKAFIVGPMSSGSWAWHVTTIVESRDRRGKEIWLAIDPVAGQVMEVKQWYKHWRHSSDDGKLRLYITEATKFAASSSGYSEQTISIPFYHNYFIDMMKWFGKNDVSRQLRH